MFTRRDIGFVTLSLAAYTATRSHANTTRANTQDMDMSDNAISNSAVDDNQWASLTPAQWKARLTDMEFRVLRKEGTERSGTSALNAEKREGEFVCAGCALPLFKSEHKYESGTGWPSFFDVIAENVGTKSDRKLFMARTEYHCNRCGGHQGHVFKDGPRPTGLRYCNNGVALGFVAKV